MKRKSFLQRLGLTLLIFAMFCGPLFTLSSCEKEPPVPACELNKVGTVIVENDTGYPGDFDVTWGDVVENYEKYIYDGSSYTYNNIPAYGHSESYGGQIELWVNLKVGSTWTDWMYRTENLSPCEDMTYRWYLSSSKSSEIQVFMDVIRDGVVINTLEAIKTDLPLVGNYKTK
jgi:hypothetical protein